jgi:uncharacterized membrane protein
MAINVARFASAAGPCWGIVRGTAVVPLSGDYPTTSALIERCAIAEIRRRAAINDEGAIALLVLTAAAALASLAAVLAELGHSPGPYQIALSIATILLSWTFMHTMFALHYLHEFYGQGADDQLGGLVFPGSEDPDYWDFLYYSLVVAMTAQVSDVQITSKTIRRLTTLHGARCGCRCRRRRYACRRCD